MKRNFLPAFLLAVTILGFSFSASAQCPSDNISVSSNSPVCYGSTLNLQANGGTAYSWTGPYGFSSILQNPSVESAGNSSTGVYYVTVTGTGGCQQVDTVIVLVLPSPLAAITPGDTQTLCPFDTIVLNVLPPTIPRNGVIGAQSSCNCPPGYVAVGFKDNSGGLLDQWQFACKHLNPDYTLDTAIVYTSKTGASLGGDPDGLKIFGGDTVMVGIAAQSFGNVNFNNLFCYGLPISQVLNYANNAASRWTLHVVSVDSKTRGSATPTDSLFALNGSVITGITLLDSSYFASTFAPDYMNLHSFFQTGASPAINSYLWSNGDTTPSIGVSTVGAYSVTVSNNFGCTSHSNVVNFVADTTHPVIVCPVNEVVYLDPINPSSAYQYYNIYTSNYCPSTIVSDPPSGSILPPGVNTINNVAFNNVGDSAFCSFTITVMDTTPPVMLCPDTLSAFLTPDSCGGKVFITPPQATDVGLGPQGAAYFSYTGSVQSWTVPPYVHSISVQAAGAIGASDNVYHSNPGYGTYITTTLNVTPGQVLYFTVGGQALDSAGGYNGGGNGSFDGHGHRGGGGGGQTNIGTTGNPLTDTLLVAAGGGGAGIYCGNEGGGNGGGPNGLPGLSCGTPDGGGATQTAGGTGLNNGTYMQGGNGTPDINNGGGGGGGGYYGGGSGVIGGGGGGSSYVTPVGSSATTYYGGGSGGPGFVSINYQPTIISVQTAGIPSGSEFPAGNSTVTYTATDLAGNTASCSFMVQVVDSSAPVIQTPANITVGDVSQACGSTVNFNVTATSRCSVTYPVVSNPPSGSFFPTGGTTVTNTAIGATGNTSISTFIVTVIDSNPPVINCQPDITVGSDPLTCQAVVSFTPPAATSYCHPSTDTFNYTGTVQSWIVPAGVDTIQVQAIGAAGSPDNAFYQQGGAGALVQTTLAVTPGQVLYFTVGGYSGNGAGGYNGGGAASYDGYGETGGGGGGQTNIGTTGNPLTDTLVVAAGGGGSGIYCDEDYGGNGGDPNGYDGLACGGRDGGGATQATGGSGLNNGAYMQGGNGNANTYSYDAGGGGGGYYGGGAGNYGGGGGGSSYVIPVGSSNTSYTAGYNCCSAGQVIITYNPTSPISYVITSGLPSGSVFPFGNSTVAYTATDLLGNTASCSFTVHVVDTAAPVYNGLGNITVADVNGTCGANVNFNVSATGHCNTGSYPVVSNHSSGSFFPLGVTLVTNTVVTILGDTFVSDFIVTVIDSNPPVISNCPGNMTVSNNLNSCGAVVSFDPPTAATYCGMQQSITFNYSGNVQQWTVPAGVNSIQVEAIGGAGSPDSYYNQQGGSSPLVQTTLAVTPGEVLYVTVGGYSGGQAGGYNGGGYGSTDGYGYYGGGGGGQTNIGTTGNPLTDTLIVAGGGGGSGIYCGDDTGGNGGDPNGYYGVYCGSNPDGYGGTQTDGGTGLNNGSYMQGGDGQTYSSGYNGGGGGGGYYGGGSAYYGGGGGGSSYVTPVGTSGTSYTDGFNYGGSGQVTISYAYPVTLTQTQGLPSGSVFPLGTNVVIYTATNLAGATSNCTFVISVGQTTTPASVTICEGSSYNYNGQILTQTGVYYDTLVSSGACDSLVALILTVTPAPTSSFSQTICQGQSYTFNGMNLTQTGRYYDTLQTGGGCDSIAILNLTVNNAATSSFSQTICQGQSYTFNGMNLTQTGRYYDTLQTGGGCDSIAILNLTVNNAATSSFSQTICQGQSYTFNGMNLTQTGRYYDTLQTGGGCDSIVILNLTVNNAATSSFSQTICQGQSYTFNGMNLTQPGSYNDTLQTGGGCDSIITLTLTVTPALTSSFSQSICSGASYSFGGNNLTQPGSYNDTLTTLGGCDSIVTLNLTVNTGSTTNIYDTICSGFGTTFNGQLRTQSGAYFDTLTSGGGCDSIIIFNLTVTPPLTSSFSQSICTGSSYSFGGNTLTQPGSYNDTLTTLGGCDSIVTLNLTVNTGSTTNIYDTICSGFGTTFNGQLRTQSGAYADTLTNGGGCDSIIIFNLTVTPPLTSSFSQSICSGTSYSFGGNNLTQPGSYNDTLTTLGGCDSIVTLNLTVNTGSTTNIYDTICSGFGTTFNGQLRTQSGAYYDTLTNGGGCDSIIIFNLTVSPPYASSFSQSICTGGSYSFGGNTLTQPGSYNDTLTSVSGCDSIVTLNLTVNSTLTTILTDTICSNSGITFNGILITQAGTYYDTLTSSGGCDSIVTLNLTVNSVLTSSFNDTICGGGTYNFNGVDLISAGSYTDTLMSVAGCDSIVTLNLTVNPILRTVLYDTICSGSSVMFNGQSLDTTGTYFNPLFSSSGCDSLIVFNLTVLPPLTTNLSDTICAGFGFPFGGQLRMQPGIYSDTLTGTGGCDSVVTLNLTVLGSSGTTLYDTICSGSSIMFNGQSLDTTGTYYNPLTSSFGCDSLVTLYLTVLPGTTTNISDTICFGLGFPFGGQLRMQPGTYSDTLTGTGGCDSIITLNLTVLGSSGTTLYDTICSGSSIMFNGQSLDTTGTYYNPLFSAFGCDSLVTLYLTVLPNSTTILADTICSGFGITFNGVLQTVAGTYYDTLSSVSGCDSIIIFNLTVRQPITSSFSQSICSGSSYNFNGKNETQSGSYNDTLTAVSGCDSIVTLSLTVNSAIDATNLYDTICQGASYSFNGQNLIVSGTYADTLSGSGGCDSIVILNLQVKSISPPVISVSGSTNLCPGGNVTLDAGAGYSTYLWIPQSSNSETVVVTQTGAYYSIVTSGGCHVSSDTIQVNVNPITVGFATAIDNDSISFTNASTNATSYLWSFGDGDTSSAQNPSHAYTSTGSYTVILTVTNNSCSLADTQSVTTGCQEAQLTTGISGPTSVCAGSLQTYTTQGNSYTSTYTWISGGNCSIISGQGTNTITVQFMSDFTEDARLRVYAKGCLGYGTSRSITIMNGVTPPGAIIGAVNGVCGGTTQTYSVAPVNGTISYNWLVTGAQLISGQGTDSITVNFPIGYNAVSVSVQTESNCGLSKPVAVQVTSDLSIGNLNGGTSGYCAGSNGVVISIPTITAASAYTWLVPNDISIAGGQGTNAITVNIAPSFVNGTVSVYASSICGFGPVKNFLISGNPAMPAKIIGPPLVCNGVEATDSVKPVASATSYTWTVPSGWTIDGPSNTNRVSYTPAQGTGYLTVTANNGCGSSAALTTHLGALLCDKIGDITDTTGGILADMKVFPNPFTDRFEVVFEAPAAMNIRLRLYTIQGQLLKELNQQTTTGTNTIQINISDEAAGVYILDAAFANETKVLRMVKQ